MWSRGLGISCVGGRRGRCVQREEEKPLSKPVHEWYFVHIIEREHRCVRASTLLITGLRTEEIVLCARLVRHVRRRAVKLGNLDRNGRDHRDIEVLVKHWCTPVDPQVWRRRPRIWLVLKRERKLRQRIKHREGCMCLPSVRTNVQRLECRRGVRGSLRRGRSRRVCVRGSRRRFEERLRIGLTGRHSEWVERRHVEHVHINVIARSTFGNPSLMLGKSGHERTIGRDVVVINARR